MSIQWRQRRLGEDAAFLEDFGDAFSFALPADFGGFFSVDLAEELKGKILQ